MTRSTFFLLIIVVLFFHILQIHFQVKTHLVVTEVFHVLVLFFFQCTSRRNTADQFIFLLVQNNDWVHGNSISLCTFVKSQFPGVTCSGLLSGFPAWSLVQRLGLACGVFSCWSSVRDHALICRDSNLIFVKYGGNDCNKL